MGTTTALFFAALLMSVGAAAHTRIYSYVDADGMKHFTDMPDDNRYRLLVLPRNARTESGERYSPLLLAKSAEYDHLIESAAAASSVESNLLRAVIVVESGFDPHAVSKRGAVGLMQLMPATGARFNVANAYDPKENIRGGARYLAFLMNRFGRDVKLVLAAYNAGEEAVARSGGRIPPYEETMAYVPKVLEAYRLLNDQPRRRSGSPAFTLTAAR